MRLVWGIVSTVVEEWEGLQRLEVRLDGDEAPRAALSYPPLAGRCARGDRVVVNTTAVDLGLGTGGADLVVVRVPEGGSLEGEVHADVSGGHIMKLRYSPLQRDVLSVEEQESPHHRVMSGATDLGGMPVVCCGLHSQVAPVAAAVKAADPALVVAYVMTDQATLALAMSRTVHACVDAGLLDTTVTCGQAFGGAIEAVNPYSGLLAARWVAGSDVAVVSIGPGVAGTGTPFGHGGVAQGEAVNAAAAVGGEPVAVLRVSFADDRERHRGLSHHTVWALTRVALAPARVAVPRLPVEQASELDASLAEADLFGVHARVDSPVGPDELPDMRGVPLETMGRGPDEAPAFFAAAAAAGEVAARVARDHETT